MKKISLPFLDDLNENTLKIRRNLIAASAIAIFCQYYKVPIDIILGIKGHVDPDAIQTGSIFLISYLSIHFFVNCFDWLVHSRIRITGSNQSSATAIIFPKELDDPLNDVNDARQSTLNNWFIRKIREIQCVDIEKNLESINNEIVTLRVDVEKNAQNPNQVNLISEKIEIIKKEINKYPDHVTSIKKLLDGKKDRIGQSLNRFEEWFQRYPKIQWRRILLVEMLFPLTLGLWAIASLCWDLQGKDVFLYLGYISGGEIFLFYVFCWYLKCRSKKVSF